MNIGRRSAAPRGFAWVLGLTLGGAAYMVLAAGCSSGSVDGLTHSGGDPLGGGSNNDPQGNDASTSQPTGDGSAAAPADGGSADAGGEGGIVLDLDGSGDAGDSGGAVANFTLIDTAITGVVGGSPVANFDPIPEGTTINLAHVGTALSIRANAVPAMVGSVAFALDATYTHTANTAPYFLCGDDSDAGDAGAAASCAAHFTLGKHTLTATPYSATSLGGDAGAPFEIDFTIVDVDGGGGGEGGGG